MRKLLLLAALVLSLSLLVNCGGSTTTAGGSGTSMVTISVGDNGTSAQVKVEKNSLVARLANYLCSINLLGSAVAAIPVEVSHVVFTISATDMTTISRDIPVTGQSSIVQSFTIPNGPDRQFLVEARDSGNKLLFSNNARANLSGFPVTLSLELKDVAPPAFGGILTAIPTSPTEINLTWSPATDTVTSSTQIVYLIYMAKSSGGENFSLPTFTSSAGATAYAVTGLSPGIYHFMVRARDAAGNTDTNSVEKSAATINSQLSVVESCAPFASGNGVTVTVSATITNTGNETLNSITCVDNQAKTLTGIPVSLAPGAAATISGSYVPLAETGPYTDNLTCSGTGTVSGIRVTGNSSAVCNFSPAVSLANVSCTDYGATAGHSIHGELTNTGNEPVQNLTCTDSMLAQILIYGSAENQITELALAETGFLSSYSQNSAGSSNTVSCSGAGFYSNRSFSQSVTIPCSISLQ